MPEHLGSIRLKGKAAEKLLKSVGNSMSATVTGKVESASFDVDFSEPIPDNPKKEKKKIAQVTIDITGIGGIHNPAHKSLQEVVEGD